MPDKGTVDQIAQRYIEVAAERDALLAQNERLLADIERWNATIAVGQAKAKQMEAVIEAARELTIIQNEGYAKLVSRLIRLTEALEAYDANPVPLPAPFSQS